MKREHIPAFLKALGCKVPGLQPRADWVISECPLGPWNHEDGKSSPGVFGIRCEPGDSFTNCFACGWHGTQRDLILTIRTKRKNAPTERNIDLAAAVQLVAQAEEQTSYLNTNPNLDEILFGGAAVKELLPFPETMLKGLPAISDAKMGVAYVESRGMHLPTLAQMDVRFDPFRKRVVWPVRDFKGRLMGLHGRSIIKGVEPRYKMYPFKQPDGSNWTNAKVWLGEHWVDLLKPIIVVEGPVDLARVRRFYANTVCPLFATPSVEKLKRMADAPEWWTFLDRGTGGTIGRKRIENLFKDTMVVGHLIPPEHRKDPGEMTDGEILDILVENGLVTLEVTEEPG